MDARRLRFGAMLAATLGVVGLALVLGVSRGGGEQAGAQGAVPTTTTATATPSPGSPLGDAPGVTLVTPTASPASTPPASSTPEISDDSHLGRRATPTPAPVLAGTVATAPTPATPATPTTSATSLPANPPQCTATTLGGSRTANAGLAGDCDTLLSIETTLKGTGQPWRGLNWEPGTAITGWKGVTVAGTPKRVTKLYLYASGLTGTIPTQVGDLTGLTELNLSWNQLTGTIPTQVGSLTKLTKLYLYGNRLTGSIPTQVGALTKLEQLYLYGNRLTGSIPTQVRGLVELETLELAGNGLTGGIPTQVGSLTKLRQLELHTNRLTGVIPTQVGSLTKLTQLRLQGNLLSGSIPAGLGSLTGLANLDLSRNRLTGAIPAELGSLTKLTALRLNGNALTGSIPAGLGSLTKLRTLALSGNALTGCVPPPLWLVTTNDLAGAAYCPVPRGGIALVAGKYQFPNSVLVISIPSTNHEIVWSETIVSAAGFHFCLKDQTEKTSICLDSADGSVDLREVFPGSSLDSGPSGASTNRFAAPAKSDAPFTVLDSVVSSTLP